MGLNILGARLMLLLPSVTDETPGEEAAAASSAAVWMTAPFSGAGWPLTGGGGGRDEGTTVTVARSPKPP